MFKLKHSTISVVIPAYNAEDSISSCIDSVLNQSQIQHIVELVVVNDGSTDKTARIVEDLIANSKSAIKMKIINQENKGVSAARNNGIKSSTGEWIAFLDSDDQWRKDKIELSVGAVKKHPEITALGSNRSSFMRTQGKKVDEGLYRLSTRDQLWSPWPTTSSLMVKRNVIDEVGMFDESRTHAEDVDLLLRITPKYGVYYLYQPLLIFASKASYGDSGLSANMKKMHQGSLQNVKNSRARGDISALEYLCFSVWENFKYLRRVLKARAGTVK